MHGDGGALSVGDVGVFGGRLSVINSAWRKGIWFDLTRREGWGYTVPHFVLPHRPLMPALDLVEDVVVVLLVKVWPSI